MYVVCRVSLKRSIRDGTYIGRPETDWTVPRENEKAGRPLCLMRIQEWDRERKPGRTIIKYKKRRGIGLHTNRQAKGNKKKWKENQTPHRLEVISMRLNLSRSRSKSHHLRRMNPFHPDQFPSTRRIKERERERDNRPPSLSSPPSSPTPHICQPRTSPSTPPRTAC